MDYLCAKFGSFSFSCFSFITRTESQQRRMIAILHHVGVSNEEEDDDDSDNVTCE